MAAQPVAILEGLRAVGKTTLTHQLADAGLAIEERADLADRRTRERAEQDPAGFVRALRTPAVIDEAQLVPDLLVAIKGVIDERPGPRQLLLTGSARLSRSGLGGSDPLAGRTLPATRLRPLTQGELAGRPVETMSWLFDGPVEPGEVVPTSAADIIRRAVRGGLPTMPGVITPGSPAISRRALGTYPEAALPFSLAAAAVDRTRLLRTYEYLAANPYQLLNITRAANELGISRDTVMNHLGILQRAFLLVSIPAMRRDPARQVTAHPRVIAGDTALACVAMALTASGGPTAKQTGAAHELVVAAELLAQADWQSEPIAVSHWRDGRGNEVDFVLAHPDGRLVAVEVKSSSTAGPRDAKGIRAFAAAFPERFHRGFVLHPGAGRHPIGADVWAIPISDLWNPDLPRSPGARGGPRMTGPDAESAPDGPRGPALFISYTRADDESEGGQIVALARALAARYKVRTGEDLETFIDKDSIKWGEEWQRRIDQQLQRTTMFVPFVSPLFLASAACRAELTSFLGAAEVTGQKGHLLPVLFHHVDPASLADDPVTATIPATQWFDWQELKYEEVTSGPVRRALDAMVDRLSEIVHAPPSSTPPETESSPLFDDGLDDLMARFEPQADRFVRSAMNLRDAFEAFGEGFAATGPRLQVAGEGRSPSALRETMASVADTLEPNVIGLVDATDELATARQDLDATVTAILRIVGGMSTSTGRPPGLEQLWESLDAMPDGVGIDPQQLSEVKQAIAMLGAFSSALRPIAKALDRAVDAVVDTEAMVRSWKTQGRVLRP